MAKKKIDDGAYQSAVTGAGLMETDKTESVTSSPYQPVDIKEMARMASQDGVADRIVNCIPEAALKHDIIIVGDDDGEVLKEFNRIGLRKALQKAGAQTRLTGGAIIVTEYEGDTPQELANEPRKGKKVTGYRVYSAGRVDLQQTDFDGEEPRVFRINLLDGTSREINPSRVTVMHGKELSDAMGFVNLRENYFGRSVLKLSEDELKVHASTKKAVGNMASETGTLLASMDGLAQILANPNEASRRLHDAVSSMKLSMNAMRAIIVGKGDQFQIMSHNFSGIPEILREQKGDVAASCGIPLSILYERTATGLGQTNQGDLDIFADLVEQWRTTYMYDPACKLIADLSRRNCGKECDEFTWGPVNVMGVVDKLNAQKTQAETLNIYYQMGAIGTDPIHDAIFKNGHSWEVSTED